MLTRTTVLRIKSTISRAYSPRKENWRNDTETPEVSSNEHTFVQNGWISLFPCGGGSVSRELGCGIRRPVVCDGGRKLQ